MKKILKLKIIIATQSTNTLPNLRFFSTTKIKRFPSQNNSGGLSDEERRYLNESLERAGALMTNLRMHRNDIYDYLDELGESEEAQGEVQDELRQLWTETEFTEDAIDINRFLLYGQEPGIKNFESWSRVRNDIGAYNASDNANFDNLYRHVEQIIATTYPTQEFEYQWNITEALAPFNPIRLPDESVQNESRNEELGQENAESSQTNKPESEDSGQENAGSSQASEPESEASGQENTEGTQANEPESEASGQKDAEGSQTSNSSMTEDQEDLGSVFENMFNPNSIMHKTTDSQDNTLNQNSTAQGNTSTQNTATQDFSTKEASANEDTTKESSPNEDYTKKGTSNNDKGGSPDDDKGGSPNDGKGGPPSPQGGGSILDDFGDPSTEFGDFMGGDD